MKENKRLYSRVVIVLSKPAKCALMDWEPHSDRIIIM